MAQLSHMTVTLNAMQAQLKTLASAPTNQKKSNIKYYYFSFGSNYIHGRKTWSANKAGYQEESYYKKILGGSEEGCKWRLGAIINKIEISNPKISLINCIGTPPNYPSNNTLAIADSGVNIHLEKQDTTTMAFVIILSEITARIPDGRTMESSHIATLQLRGLIKQASQIHILTKIKTAPLISLVVLCDDGCTITLYIQDMPVQKHLQELIKGTRNKKTWMWEVPLKHTTIRSCD